MHKLKEKIVSTLGGFGYILYFLISLLFVIFPLAIIEMPFIIKLLIILAANLIPLGQDIAWMVIYPWGLVVTIQGEQDFIAILYYIFFTVYILVSFIPFISNLLSMLINIKNR